MSQFPQPTDRELIRLILAGQEIAFRHLVERYQGPVYGCAYAITRNQADAADAAQEAFIRLHRHLAQYDPARPLKPYLLTIAANCSRRLVNDRTRRPTSTDTEHLESLLESLPDTAPGPARQLNLTERQKGIRQMVEALPQTMREVCALFYLQQCSCREVADILGMNESAVKTALHRARRKLQTQGIGQWRSLS